MPPRGKPRGRLAEAGGVDPTASRDRPAPDGLGEGDRLAVVGAGTSALHMYFARLARVRIVAAVTEIPAGWLVSRELRAALRRSGAELLVAEDVTAARGTRGWRRLPGSDFYLTRL